ncbi:hypothetical protein [Pedobacter sp.]|uniref:hypothetical protein n=1 Tax=Pedobacter sp. TaxID=1411316 RepID=UPI003D7F575F
MVLLISILVTFTTGLKAQQPVVLNVIDSLTIRPVHPPVFEGITTDTTHLLLSDWPVTLVKYSYGEPKINFIAIHDDEDTGVKAAFEYIRFSGGSIIDCQYGGIRNFKFMYNNEEFQTDPNSIYTPAGIARGLEKYNWAAPEVVNMLANTAKEILKLYNPETPPYIFTLHNNGDGGFGIHDYLKGYPLENFADSLYINFEMDADDLILVTDVNLFNRLKKENVNVVLQSNNAPDDGSLSYYAMQQRIPYVNVEVQHGHLYEHLRLIEIAAKALEETILPL